MRRHMQGIALWLAVSAVGLGAQAPLAETWKSLAETWDWITGGPSLAETLAWINGRLLANSQGPYRALAFDECTVQYVETVTTTPPYELRTVLSFADMDPASVREWVLVGPAPRNQRYSYVKVGSRSGRAFMRRGSNDGRLESRQEYDFLVTSEIAPRFAKAVAHAATLCAKEPF